jgi:hypothetical protein
LRAVTPQGLEEVIDMSPAMLFDAVPQLPASCIEHEVIGQSAVFEFLNKSFHDVKLGVGVTA